MHIPGAVMAMMASLSLLGGPAMAGDSLRFVTLEFAPFIYGENQQVAGPGRDVIAAVCERAEVDCSFDIYPWRRAQELMKSGDADGMMVIGRNPGREEWLRFSPPMFRTEYGFFVRADNPVEFSGPGQIAGYRVGVFGAIEHRHPAGGYPYRDGRGRYCPDRNRRPPGRRGRSAQTGGGPA